MLKKKVRKFSVLLLLLALTVIQFANCRLSTKAAQKEYKCYGTYVLKLNDSEGRGKLKCTLNIEEHSDYCGKGCIGLNYSIEVEGLFGDHKYDTYQGGDLIRTGTNKYKSVDEINNLKVSFKVLNNKKIKVTIKGTPSWSYFKKPNGVYKLKTRPDYSQAG